MADRQANINVNYNINTQSVQAAEATVKRAQQATDQFQKSVGQTGTTWQKTSQQFLSNGERIGNTIDKQRLQMQQLRAQIELTRASDTKRLQQLTADYKTLKTSVDSFNKSLQTQQQQTQSLTQSFGGLIAGVKAFLAAGLVREVVQGQLEMAKLAGQFEGVERAFKRLPQSTQLLEELRKSTHGAVSDLGLMQQALRANNFEIDLTKLGKLLEFAATRAQQTGQEVDYLVNSIVMGIGMKSILRLDNLGLSATRLKEELGGVSVKAASVAQLTAVVAKVADESQQKLGGYFETSATKVAQLSTTWENFKVSLSKGVGGSWLTTFLTDTLEGWRNTIEGLRRGMSAADVVAEQLQKEKALADDLNFAKKELTGTTEQNIAKVKEEIASVAKVINEYAAWEVAIRNRNRALTEELKTVTPFSERGRQIREELLLLQKQLELGTAENGLTKQQLIGENEYIKLLRERLLALEDTDKEITKQLGIVERLMDLIEEAEDGIQTATSIAEIQRLQVVVQDLNKELDLVLGNFNDFAKLKLGQQTSSSTGVQKLGAEISTLSVPVETIDQLTEKLNKRFKENPPKVPLDLDPKFDWESIFNGDDFTNSMFDLAQGIEGELIKATLFAEVDAYNKRIDKAEEFYDRQRELAGEAYEEQTEAERKRDQELAQIEEQRIKTVDRLRKQQAEKEIRARRLSVIIDTAAGIARAFATSSNIYQAIIQAAIVAGYGASQLAIINKQKANFAEGVIDLKGAGTGTSDSIPANLSRGESVMTAKETQSSMGILKAIRAKRLDDRVLEQIKSGRSGGSQGTFNDAGIIKAIKEKKEPDFIQRHGVLYKVYEKQGGFRRIQRAKSMGE